MLGIQGTNVSLQAVFNMLKTKTVICLSTCGKDASLQ